jgi:hypothetical protein
MTVSQRSNTIVLYNFGKEKFQKLKIFFVAFFKERVYFKMMLKISYSPLLTCLVF